MSAVGQSFWKKKFLSEGANTCKIELDEIHEVKGLTHIELDLIGESNLKPVEAPLKRSDRVPHQSDRYYSFFIRDGDLIELDENDENPITYMEAMQRSDSQKWLDVIKSEMESMEINSVWTLVDPFERIKSIGCK